MDSPIKTMFELPCARDLPRRSPEWQEAEMLSLIDSNRCNSVELDRNMIFCGEAAQLCVEGQCPPERMLGPVRGLQATAAKEEKMGTTGTERSSFKELASEILKGAAGTGMVSSTLLQDVSHPRIADLEKQIQELLNINKAWDKHYRHMKQHYEAKIQQLRDRLAACNCRAQKAEEEVERRQRDFDKEMLKAKKTIKSTEKRNSEISAQLLESERQMRQLRLQQEDLATRGKQQDHEIQRLNQVLQDSLAELDVAKTELEVRKQQEHIYKSDFKLERQDRERLKAQNLKLEKMVAKLNLQPLKPRSSVKGQQQLPCSCAGRSACPTRNTDSE